MVEHFKLDQKVGPTIPETLPDGTVQHIGTDLNFKREIVWKNAIGFLVLHLAGLYGIYLMFYSKLATVVFGFVTGFLASEGITIGAHRLYTHRGFKASPLLRFILVTLQTIAGQNCMFIWVRDHRQHHKYSDTDADPHNATRGFFFSHIGWLMSKKHPLVIAKGKGIDMSDLLADKLVMFQKKHYKKLYYLMAIIMPVSVPIFLWNESLTNALFICYFSRYILQLNGTWCVNSVAHIWGTKPFDKTITPVESAFVSFIGAGEGWHNYHHSFPWDYRASEYGAKYNLSAYLIELFAKANLASDLRTASLDMVRSRVMKRGDGTHPVYKRRNMEGVVEDLEPRKPSW